MPEPNQVEYLLGSSLLDRLLGLPTNVRLGLKSQSGTKTLAYLAPSLVPMKKSFITFFPELYNVAL